MLSRWFPRGFATEGVDWSALEQELSMVPDFAFQITTGNNKSSTVIQGEAIPNGVCALHLVVSCCNPAAPLTLVQRLIDINPDSLRQTTEGSCWNVLHCALQYNKNLKNDQQLIELLIKANAELVTEISTSIEDFGLPPLAYAQCREVVPILVKAMPTAVVVGILKKIFTRRKLLGGSIEAMEQIIREISAVELHQSRSILSSGIISEKGTRRQQSLVEYVLLQASLRRRSSPERVELMRLVDTIMQAMYCLTFQNGDDDGQKTIMTAPSPIQCLKTLVAHQKIKCQALEQYQSTKVSNNNQSEKLDLVETACHIPLNGTGSDAGQTNGEPTAQTVDRRNHFFVEPTRDLVDVDERPSHANPYIQRLLKEKETLDAKIEKSFGFLRQTALALEEYKELYAKTVDRLCNESQNLEHKENQSGAAAAAAAATVTTNQSSDDTEEKMEAIRAFVALSSSVAPPKPPIRQDSRGSLEEEKSPSLRLDATIQEAIENMKDANKAMDRYNKKLAFESTTLVKEQEEQELLDLVFFHSKEHDQAAQAAEGIAECQISKEGLKKLVDELKCELKEIENSTQTGCKQINEKRHNLNLRLIRLGGEIREVTRTIENLRTIVTKRRQDLGGHLMKARRIISGKTSSSQPTRTKANRFVREGKKEMRSLLKILNTSDIERQRHTKERRWRRRQHKREKMTARAEEEELTRMTKRMKL